MRNLMKRKPVIILDVKYKTENAKIKLNYYFFYDYYYF